MSKKPSGRKCTSERKTKETEIRIVIDPDSKGEVSIKTTLPFFDHILTAMAFHGGFSLSISAKGDTDVDPHHLVEDTGIVLGDVLNKIVSEHGPVARFGNAMIPMDDSLAEVVIDVCGRPYLIYKCSYPQPFAGQFDISLLKEFFVGLATHAKINIHAGTRYGENSHHLAEALFKALGKAIFQAYTLKNGSLPESMSTKGTIA
ncbi:MAG: imidazoleglycerol-phosphate dehydratase HisB [Spirochaetales bacterium]|nr:imidazoleglycerol-phosphate dehydratase HisB [Spirochaetales bacterium]